MKRDKLTKCDRITCNNLGVFSLYSQHLFDSAVKNFATNGYVDYANMGFPAGASGKEPTCQCRRCKRLRFDPWVGKIPWRRKWQPTGIFLPGKSHGQKSLAGYRPQGHKQSDTTVHTHLTPLVNMEKGFQEGERSTRAKKEIWSTEGQPAESTVRNSSPRGFYLIVIQKLNRRTLCKGSDLIFLSLEFIFPSPQQLLRLRLTNL